MIYPGWCFSTAFSFYFLFSFQLISKCGVESQWLMFSIMSIMKWYIDFIQNHTCSVHSWHLLSVLTCRVWQEGWPLQSSGISQDFPQEQAEVPLRDWQVGDLKGKRYWDTDTLLYNCFLYLRRKIWHLVLLGRQYRYNTTSKRYCQTHQLKIIYIFIQGTYIFQMYFFSCDPKLILILV